jgi:hypothetical protein
MKHVNRLHQSVIDSYLERCDQIENIQLNIPVVYNDTI